MNIETFDTLFINRIHKHAIPTLRITLGIVYFWFGVLKVLNLSPIRELVINLYSFLPTDIFFIILGIAEIVIGMGLIFKVNLRVILLLVWIQMAGIFASFIIAPSVFFQSSNPFLLTFEGEFIIKNIILVAASIVVAGFEISPAEKFSNKDATTDNI